MWDLSNVKRVVLFILIFSIGFVIISLISIVLFIRPSKIYANVTPEQLNLPAKIVALTSDDGLKLSAWFIESPSRSDHKRAIIFLHGYPAEKSDMLHIASSFYPDFSLFLMDLRYFGESEGSYTTLGIKEPEDVGHALDYLAQEGYERIGIFGFSFGGAVGMLSAAEDNRVNAVAAYAAYADLKLIGYDAYQNLSILKYSLVEAMALLGRIVFGESIDNASPLRAAKNLSIPVFLIHSRQDEQIPFHHFERLQKALAANQKLEVFIIEEGFHGYLPPDASSQLKAFFEAAL